MQELKLPMFLLAEDPKMPYKGINYIYSPLYLTFIMVVSEDDTTIILNSKNIHNVRKTYHYQDESFEFVIIQNNIKITAGQLAPVVSEVEFLDNAFKWYEEYLIWEDLNIEELGTSEFN